MFDEDHAEEEDASQVFALDAEAAALAYADRFDSDRHEMGILRHGITVTVIGGEERVRFNLTGESVPSYSAEALGPVEEDEA